MKRTVVILFLSLFFHTADAQLFSFLTGKKDEKFDMLLMDRGIQINTTSAVNNMYNFKFAEAEKEYKWLKVKYPDHPIGDFMLGLNEWWKIIPDTNVELYDEACQNYMDSAIDKAEDLLSRNSKNHEAAFFLSAAYAIKGRLYAEREKWIKAAWAGKQAMKYLASSRGEENINPELLFGDGIYNYYSKWIHENYKSLRPLLTFFRKGDKATGIKQLENVANYSFYSRMEARYFLIQIYAMEGQPVKSLVMSREMHALYPDNSFFHRYVARNAFAIGRVEEAAVYANELLDHLKKGKYGYGNNDGRYGTYILAYYNDLYRFDKVKAKYYYIECVNYASQNNSKDSGYFLASNMALGKFAEQENNLVEAVNYYSEVLTNCEKKSDYYNQSKAKLEEITKKAKKAKRNK